tara:strand:+ start:2864 stop:7309 length:4446 start_codon:yes stop_codon:yes gene_type:complete
MPIDTSKNPLNTSTSSIRGEYMTQDEAIRYATKMGMTDSIRGLQQMYGQITNSEDLLDKLKSKDEKLNQILENEEYGGKALAAWMGSAIALDPVGVIPYFGWARKAKQMQKGASYGASLGQNVRTSTGIGAAWGGVGYYGEEDMTRGEGVLLGGALGGSLGYVAGKVGRAVNKSVSPNRKQKQQIAAKENAETIQRGEMPSPEEIKAAQDAVVSELRKEGPNTLSKSISGLNIRKNYEEIAGKKVWETMVENWGSGLVGLAAASGGYSALDDPDASQLAKFGAAIALGIASGGSAKLLGKLELKDGSSLSEFISKGMVDNYGLEADFVKLKKDSFSEVNSLKQQFLDIVRATDEVLSKDEQQVLYSMIHGVMDDVPQLKGMSDAAKKVITETGRQLVDVGLLEKTTWVKNANRYLHRSYDSKLLKAADGSQGIKSAREFKIIGDQLKPRGFLDLTTKKNFETNPRFQKEGWEIINEDKFDNVVIRRQLTKQERLDRGEIENASFAIAETGRLMTHDLSVYKLFDNISKSKYSLTEEEFLKGAASGELVEKGWKQVPLTSRYKGKAHEIYEYGNLKGKYVPEAVYNDITRLIPTTQNAFTKLIGSKYLTAMRTWKKSKTAWNPTVHVNNTMSNVMMYDHADGGYKYIARGAAELKKGLDQRTDANIFRMAREDGVLDSDILSRELNDQTMGALDKASRELSVKGRNELHGSINYSKKLGSFFTKAYDSSFRKMEDFYQAEDQVFRMALYMDRLSKGASRADAAADAKKWFIDYDINAPAINFLKNTATPFLSYTYRVVPLLAETAAKRPWKFAKWAALGYTANELGKKYGVGDSEAEKRLLDPRYKQPMFGVPGMPSTTFKTPFSSGRDKDVPLYIDTTRFIPGGDIFSMGDKGIPLPIPVPFSKSITGQQKFLRTPSALNPNFGIAGEVLAPMMFGVDPFTHNKLKGLGMGNDEMVKMQHVLSRLNPNIPAPYLLPEKYESFSSKKIREAFEHKTQETNKEYGADYSPFEAIMSSFGFKLQPVDMAKLLRIEDSNFRRIYSQARRDYFKVMQDYQMNPTAAEYDKAQEQIELIYEQLENAERVYSSKRKTKADGGIISKDFPVSDVKQDPKERVDPFAQKTYDATRKGFALGGEVDNFSPLAEEIERLASMQSSEEGSLLQGGAMPMSTLERKAKRREFQEGAYVGPPKFEKRIARPDPEMFIKDPQSGNPQTHRMGWGDIDGKFIAYPTIVEEDGKLVQYKNNNKTMKLMKKTGNFKTFDTKEEAKAYAEGAWKTKEFHETYRKKLNEGGRVLKALKALAEDGTFLFEPEKAFDKEGKRIADINANKGDGPAKFVQMVYENAVALGLKHPEWIAAQAGAESRYGASDLAQGSNNILGIKLRANEEGPSKMYPTKEQQTTGLEPEMANFREFASIDESLQGYDTFLRTGINKEGLPRYDKALAAPTGPEYIQELKNAGYATDDSYVKLITDVHNQYFGTPK